MMVINPYCFLASGGVTPPAIGDYWEGQGGYYAGSITYPDSRNFHLVVADRAATLTFLPWGYYGVSTGATSVYDGAANTEVVASRQNYIAENPPAFVHCVNYAGGGKTDWYFPALNEVLVIYTNLNPSGVSTPAAFKTGGTQAYYTDRVFTSSETSIIASETVYFADGTHTAINKESVSDQVRPIRRIQYWL